MISVTMKIRIDIENVIDDENIAELSEDQIDMCNTIACDSLPQSLQLYYNGEDNPPAKVFIEVEEIEETEIY